MQPLSGLKLDSPDLHTLYYSGQLCTEMDTQNLWKLIYNFLYCHVYKVSYESKAIGALSYLVNMEKCKEGNLLQIICFQSQVLEPFTYDKQWLLCTLYINGNDLWQCCQGDMMVKGGYVSRVGGSGSDVYNMKQE
jgi:hypothetical protein